MPEKLGGTRIRSATCLVFPRVPLLSGETNCIPAFTKTALRSVEEVLFKGDSITAMQMLSSASESDVDEVLDNVLSIAESVDATVDEMGDAFGHFLKANRCHMSDRQVIRLDLLIRQEQNPAKPAELNLITLMSKRPIVDKFDVFILDCLNFIKLLGQVWFYINYNYYPAKLDLQYFWPFSKSKDRKIQK